MIEVSAAIIFVQNKILCLQRGKSKYNYVSYKYEFPGGKLNKGEDPVKALKREIKEELIIEIEVKEKFKTIFHEYPDFSYDQRGRLKPPLLKHYHLPIMFQSPFPYKNYLISQAHQVEFLYGY